MSLNIRMRAYGPPLKIPNLDELLRLEMARVNAAYAELAERVAEYRDQESWVDAWDAFYRAHIVTIRACLAQEAKGKGFICTIPAESPRFPA